MPVTNTMVKVELRNNFDAKCKAIVVPLMEATNRPAAGENLLSAPQLACLDRLIGGKISTGKTAELHFDLLSSTSGKNSDLQRVYVAGLGEKTKYTTEILRKVGGAIARMARKNKFSELSVLVTESKEINAAQFSDAIVTGFMLANFSFDELKGTAHKKPEDKAKKTDDDKKSPVKLTLVHANSSSIKAAVDRAVVVADGQNFARTIASRPGNVINPPTLATAAQQMAKEVGLGFKVLDEKQMAKLGMGGILAVGNASATPPRMIILEHKGNAKSKKKPLLVVGKAITFDAGGISIKGAAGMGRMVFDKCGGMAVLGFMYAVAKLKLDRPIIGILSSAENTLGSRAMRPGDILTMYNGVTVEVTNTDAEGRLVLGDALAWGIETYKPEKVIDLATLTGGVVVALGGTMAGAMSNSDSLIAELQKASDETGEKFWRLPLNDDHRDYIKSHYADIVNSGGREGHPLQGGAFLSFFVPKDNSIPWVHLDIAGVADIEKDLPYYAKGATGWGVRTLINWATAQSK